MSAWGLRLLSVSAVSVCFAAFCVDGAESSDDGDELVQLSALVPVLLNEHNHVSLDGKGPVPMTSENPDNWYWEPPTELCDSNVEQVDYLGDDDLFVYFSSGDWDYLAEWLSSERVATASERYASGVKAAGACVDAGIFEAMKVSYPGIDEARVYTKKVDEEWDRTVLYARNGGVILLLTLGYYSLDTYGYEDIELTGQEVIERSLGTALGKLAALGQVEVAEDSWSSNALTAPTELVETTVAPHDVPTTEPISESVSAPPIAATTEASAPPGVEPTPPTGAVVTETTTSMDVESDLLEASLLTAEEVGGGLERQREPMVFGYGDGMEPFQRCPNGVEMAVPVKEAYVSFLPQWAGEYDSFSDDEIIESVYVFDSPGDVASWFEGYESCAGQNWESADPEVEARITSEHSAAPDLGDESRGFRTLVSFSDGSELAVYAVLVRLGEVLAMINYVDYSNPPLHFDEPIDQPFFEGLVETAIAKLAAALQ